jgi:hypothetical protein
MSVATIRSVELSLHVYDQIERPAMSRAEWVRFQTGLSLRIVSQVLRILRK